MTFRAGMGRAVIGRSDDCDVVIRDRTVSARHADLVVRPEGATITNLMATNGTWVNGVEVRSTQLHDGDMLRLGQVSLMFKDVPPAAVQPPWVRSPLKVLVAAVFVLALLALLALLLLA
jgi:pSer/pThr/pTyr-binding forkhead associated (FHA) protein